MISQLNPEIVSSLLILSNSPKQYQHLTKLLSHYFTLIQHQYLLIDNKYYKTFIKLVHQTWPQPSQLISPSQSQKQTQNQISQQQNYDAKYDLLIMLVHEEQSYSARMYDYVISKYNPQNFILVYDTKDKSKIWKDQAMISSQVNNFIEIIKQNLQVVVKQPPERVKTGLLQDNYEDGHIFNLIQLIETTPWSSIQRKPSEKPAKQHINESKVQVQKQANNSVSQNQADNESQVKISKKPQVQDIQQALDEQAMQNEMLIFQSLISQMKSMKTLSKQPQGLPDIERKKKAQSLISKLLGGGMFQ